MAESPVLALTIVALVVIAALLQRVTGLGFAMMLAPFLTVMIGPHAGVMLTNALSLAAPIIMLPLVWKHVEWRKLALIIPAAVVTLPIGGWAAEAMPQGMLSVVIGAVVFIGLTASLIISKVAKPIDGPITRILTGVGAGGGAVMAGVGGPAMTVYGVLSRWDVVKFAATLQPLWMVLSSGSLITKSIFSGGEFPQFQWWFWAASLAAILLGLFLGARIQKRVPTGHIRLVVIILAYIGAGLTLWTGTSALIA